MRFWLSSVVAASCVAISVGVVADDDDDAAILKAHTLVGVSHGFLGNANPVRGTNGGGLPWILGRGSVELRPDGLLSVTVRGLVVPDRGNPVPFFRARVSCLTTDMGGGVTTVNLTTTNGAEVMIGDPTEGNAKIRERLSLPSPCVAPIVFVTSPNGSWFAATGM